MSSQVAPEAPLEATSGHCVCVADRRSLMAPAIVPSLRSWSLLPLPALKSARNAITRPAHAIVMKRASHSESLNGWKRPNMPESLDVRYCTPL
eukprot:6061831-Prymnesium_polylepis.1